MDKATVESVMALAFELARIREQHGAQSGMYLSEVRALRAEAERLAAQAAPTTADRWNDAALPPEIEQRLAPWLTNGAALHPATVNLVVRFARALSKKLAAAETKYGYSDGWLSPDWMDECRAKLMEHIAKGDPRDVAAYCAFLWHHGASTVTSQPSQAPVVLAVQPEYCTACDMTSNDKQRCEDCPRRASSGATTQAVRMLTAEEIKALTAMVWGAPCSGHDLAVFTSAVKAMEALRPGERPMDPADGGRLLEVDACGDPMPSGRTIPPSGVIGGAA